jgi:LL-diaminopimelate aminotransferase
MIIQSSHSANSVKEYYFSKKLREIKQMQDSGIDIINLGIGNPDLAPPDVVINRLNESIHTKENHGYQSYKGIDALRHAFSHWYDTYFNTKLNPTNQVLPLIGSKAGIMHISTAFLNEGDQVLIPNPGYPAYAAAAKINGAEIIEFELHEKREYFPVLKKLEQYDLSKVKLMWVNYTNMPTGQKASKEQLKELIDFGKRNNILIVNDNPYSFILNDEPVSILSIEGAFETALELNSLSKSHNMAGWRIGVLFGREDYIQTVQKIQSNLISGMYLPLQHAAIEALHMEQSWYDSLNEIYKERQEKVKEILDSLGCSYRDNQSGMFLWAKIPHSFKDSYEYSDYLTDTYKIFIAPGGIFGSLGNTHIRISLCNTVETLNTVSERIQSRKTKGHT